MFVQVNIPETKKLGYKTVYSMITNHFYEDELNKKKKCWSLLTDDHLNDLMKISSTNFAATLRNLSIPNNNVIFQIKLLNDEIIK